MLQCVVSMFGPSCIYCSKSDSIEMSAIERNVLIRDIPERICYLKNEYDDIDEDVILCGNETFCQKLRADIKKLNQEKYNKKNNLHIRIIGD